MANFAPRGGVFPRPGPPRGGDRGEARDRAPSPNDRKRMLDVGREGHFRFDLKEILLQSTLPPEQVASFVATVVSKGARQSTMDAKDWVTSKLNEGVIAKAERDAINTLIDRYSKWR